MGTAYVMHPGSSVIVLLTVVTNGAEGLMSLPASLSPDELIVTKGKTLLSSLLRPHCLCHNLPDQRLLTLQ